MPVVLCYGDSNTWGYDPATRSRYPRDVRWTGVLRNTLGPDYSVVEEGLNGRTTVWDDPIDGADRNGATFFGVALETHAPVDLVIIMLGTNDLKHRFHLAPSDIAAGAGQLVRRAMLSRSGPKGSAPRVLLVCPPPLASLAGTLNEGNYEGGEEKSRQLAPHYERVAKSFGCDFLNAGEIVTSSPIDATHWAADEHRKFGERVAAYIRSLFTQTG